MKPVIQSILLIFILLLHEYSIAKGIYGDQANDFLKDGLAFAERLYGLPRINVKSVTLKNTNEQAYTSITNKEAGLFTIYLSRKPEEYSFYGQLAHEIAHLLNAEVYDVYVEGLNGVFAEKLLKKYGKDWSGWEQFYRKGGDPFYASTYFMMKEVETTAGSNSIKSLLGYAKPLKNNSKRMYIDIDSWLNSLSREKSIQIKRIIMKHAPTIRESMASVNQIYNFNIPK